MSAETQPPVDLAGYFDRIEYSGRPAADTETLCALHVAHATHIVFENADVLAGVPIRLDLPSLEAKLVRARRGGYCFEQNMLFAAVLEQLGFRVARLQARVRWGAHRILPRTHMAIEVDVDGQPWLADVGFGGWGLMEPVPLAVGESRQFAWNYRMAKEQDTWVLQAPQAGDWQDMYAFTREGYPSVDFEPANYFVSHHPDSIFVNSFTVQRPQPKVRYILRNRDYTVATPDGTHSRMLESDRELFEILENTFGLVLPAGPWMPSFETPLDDNRARSAADG